jgi:lantibiotic modifying enzyme
MWSSQWEPLFSGTAAEPYKTAIAAIVQALDLKDAVHNDWSEALLYAYLSAAEHVLGNNLRADELIDEAIGELERGASRAALYGGVAGVAWLVTHIDALFNRRDDNAFETIDKTLLRACRHFRIPFGYDLINGAVGIGVYFIERLPHIRAVEALLQIIRALDASAEREDNYVTWHTPAPLLHESQRELMPSGHYNLGVAHGVSGIVGFLGELTRAGVYTSQVEAMLTGAIRWILSKRLRNGLFPRWIVPGVTQDPSRISWCYGELGLAVTLLIAARALHDKTVEEVAVDIGLASSTRRIDTGVVDTCLCHGAAGNAHLFNRLFQATRHLEFREAAEFWFHRALENRVEGDGIGGYLAWKRSWQCDASFLTGSTGIALSFLAATTSLEPNWDRLLLSRLDPIGKSDVLV